MVKLRIMTTAAIIVGFIYDGINCLKELLREGT